jgi:hypothetical protein
MNWVILGAALLIVLIPTMVIRFRKASRTLDAILAEHHARMDGTEPAADTAATTPTDTPTAPRRHQARHRRSGRRPRTVRPATTGYATHRRMSA